MIYLKSIAIRNFLCVVICTLLTCTANGQVKEWGEISLKEFQTDNSQTDSSAAAVILFKKGNLRVEDDLVYFLDVHVRTKILREEGYRHGTVTIDYNREYEQQVKDIKSVTYTLRPGKNKIEEHRLNKKSVYDIEIINEWNQKKFTFPALEPGCIIEYQYTLEIGDPAYIPAWYFDDTVPVKWSELSAEFPSFLRFRKVFKGDEKLYINTFEEFNKTIRYRFKTNDRSLYGIATGSRRNGHVSFNGERFRWVMKDRKGIEELPFMTTPDDYKAKMSFQLAEFNIPHKKQFDVVKDWGNVIDYLLDEDEFGTYLSDKENFEDQLASLYNKNSKALEKARAIFSHVANTYKWNGFYGFLPGNSLNDVIKTKTGSGAELNLVLTKMLREADLKADPVLISTRDHGAVSKRFILPNQFNHVIVLAVVDGRQLLLDSSMGDRSLFILPENDLKSRGLIVKKPYEEKSRWIDTMPLQNTIKAGVLQAEIKSDGSIQGRTSYQVTGYRALEERNTIKESGKDTFVNNALFGEFKKVGSDSVTFNNLSELDRVFTYAANFTSALPSSVQKTDSLIYFDNTLFMKQKDNPLKQPDRTYPVNFPYTASEQFVAVYKIPEEYEVESIPDDLVTGIPQNGGQFKRETEIKDGQIVIRSSIEIGKSVYMPDEYSRLRTFFNQIIEAQTEKIVLKKRSLTNLHRNKK